MLGETSTIDSTQRTYLGSWAGPSLDRRRNSQELPSLCIHSSSVVTGLFPESKGVVEELEVWDSAAWKKEDNTDKNTGAKLSSDYLRRGQWSVETLFPHS